MRKRRKRFRRPSDRWLPQSSSGKHTIGELASRIAKENSALAIVNTRAQAAELFTAVRELVDPASCYHLSTLMCCAHRRDVPEQIRKKCAPWVRHLDDPR